MFRKHLVISKCYFLTPNSWDWFFKKNITSTSVAVFDASHCFWLPPDLLVDGVTLMSNLEELYIHDTKFSLKHLPRVFKACGKLLKLSFSLVETTLDEYREDVMGKVPYEWMLLGFAHLTHLKVFTLNMSDTCLVSSWLVTFGVLR